MSVSRQLRTTVRLDENLLKRAKKKAVERGTTLTALIEEGLRAVTAEKASSGGKARILPRISTATGGLRPGFDPIKINTQTQEIEDLEMLKRLGMLE
jgi:hypothetical protein